MTQVSLARLYLLRAAYLFVATGLAVVVWPSLLHHDKPWELMQGVVLCVLGAVSFLAILGLRYPLQMLPLLMFEMIWKSLWLILVAVPLWTRHAMDATTWATASACLMGIIFPVVIPWRYVFANFALRNGDRWV
jgi:hypothetical protein